MQDLIKKLLESQEGIVTASVMAVYALNAILTGLRAALRRVKDKTSTQLDNKVYEVVDKILGGTDAVIGVVTANTAALPASTQAEVAKGKPVTDNTPVEPAPPSA